MELGAFQRAALETRAIESGGDQAVIPALLGLASHAGAALNRYRKHLRISGHQGPPSDFMRNELGDLLWYVAAVASALEIDLDDIGTSNIARARDQYPTNFSTHTLNELPVFDRGFPRAERFPRQLIVGFSSGQSYGRQMVTTTLVSAHPNAFPNGPVRSREKTHGYRVGATIGDPLTDNSRQTDDYRYHDAIHLGFLAALNWSPNIRSLLHIKRRSIPAVDECEDGARAIFAEEGLAAILSRLAIRRAGFQIAASIDGEVIDIARAATVGLEVEEVPGWLWRRAIVQGFSAMDQLARNGGGYLVADLDARNLTYTRDHL